MRNARIPQWANPDAYSWKDTVMRKAERGELFDPQRSAERSSLIKLAYSATQLDAVARRRDVAWPEGQSPLLVAVTALASAAKQQGRRQND
jgi:hypothetical protein